MSCNSAVPWAELVQYWAGDLDAAATDRVDEHLMGCASCSAEAARVAAVVSALRELVPPVVTRAELTAMQARGARIRENAFVPGETTAVFPRDAELLIHRLGGFDLSGAVRVHVMIRRESTRELFAEVADAPFDPVEGVLIACHRHYASLPTDVLVEVSAIDAQGGSRMAAYSIPHVFE
ncbi:MAG TPA: zf-HC2 domain-containing protein [Polyangiaceae bacterium]|nr:zf-HC2 domain-containing protein [Polyangiaceae bacterium]